MTTDKALPDHRDQTVRIAALIAVLAVLAATGLQFADLRLETLPFQLRNKDFANCWLGGRLALAGEASLLFGDPAFYFERMKTVFGADYPWHNWSYPPHAALVCLPFGMPDYLSAMALYLGLTLSLYLLAIAALPVRWTLMASMLLVPFLATNLIATQNGFLTGALMIAGLGLRERRPSLAGILLGLLTFKPQLGVLLPFLLLNERQWRVIAAAMATTTLLVGISILAFGFDAWRDFIVHIVPQQTDIMNTFGGDFPHMMASAFGAARSLGYDAAIAMKVHLPFALAGMALFALGLVRLRDAGAKAFCLLLASFLVVPYSVSYDLGALSAFAAFWPLGARRDGPPLLRIVLILLTVLPIALLPLGQAGYPLAPPLLLLVLFILLWSENALLPERIRRATPARPSRPQP